MNNSLGRTPNWIGASASLRTPAIPV